MTNTGQFINGLFALLRQRCPRCRGGQVFRGAVTMNDRCPQCGILFYRSEGYFLGAMYVSYGLSALFLGAIFFTASAFLSDWHSALVALLAVVIYLPFVPAIFRYSRVIWIWFDRWADPHGQLTGSYEEKQQQQPPRGDL